MTVPFTHHLNSTIFDAMKGQISTIVDLLAAKLGTLTPEVEFLAMAELISEIRELKAQKSAIILGHNYMEPALYHFVTDYRGDSLELSRLAAESKAPMIVFCGVVFMAETAKILNPTSRVLVPSLKAGCSLADSIRGDDVRRLKESFPGVPVVSYVNTYADVKAETDICCTSGNAVRVVESLAGEDVIFIPDAYLAANVAKETNKRLFVPSIKEKGRIEIFEGERKASLMISWPGKCEVHDQFCVEDIRAARTQFPSVKVLAHPECHPDVTAASDFTGSTSQMIAYVNHAKNRGVPFLLLTECSMADNIIAESGRKDDFLRMCHIRCPHMAQITLEQTRDSLLFEQHEIFLDANIIEKARLSLQRMLEI